MTSEFDPQEDPFVSDREPVAESAPSTNEPVSPDAPAAQSDENAAAPEIDAAPTEVISEADSSEDSFSESMAEDTEPADASSDAPADDETAGAASASGASERSVGFKVSPLAASYSGLPPFKPPRWVNGRRMISFEGAAAAPGPSLAAGASGVAAPEEESAPPPTAPPPTAPSPTGPSQAAPPGSGAAANPRLRPTADGGPPLARPIVLVTLHTDVVNAAVGAALKAATERDTKTLNEIAEAKIDFAFFKYQAERRVLHR